MSQPAWGILGGTFDPPHLGHLALAQAALTCLNLADVHWIPAGQPPHRHPPAADAAQRLAMVRLLVAHQPSFVVETVEIDCLKPSYSVDTLAHLRAREKTRPLLLLLGADAFSHLHTWRRWHKLFDLAHIAVASRQGYRPPDLADYAPELMEVIARRKTTADELARTPSGGLCFFDIESPHVSATQLRMQITHELSPVISDETRHTTSSPATPDETPPAPFSPAIADEALPTTSAKMPLGMTVPVWHYICQHKLYGKI